jgi:hypothetical protein
MRSALLGIRFGGLTDFGATVADVVNEVVVVVTELGVVAVWAMLIAEKPHRMVIPRIKALQRA